MESATSNGRYRRQLALEGFGEEGQAALSRASVAVVGAGGLGVPVLTYLNAMGVGRLTVIDGDWVEESNLHRQPAYRDADVNRSKVETMAGFLGTRNPHVEIDGHAVFLTAANAPTLLAGHDLIVDATDNFSARYLIDDYCYANAIPFVYGALHGFEGQVSVFNYRGGPTYRCLFPTPPAPGQIPDCEVNGILGILPGIVGNLQALEAVKVLTGIGEPLSGRLLLYDGLRQRTHEITFSRSDAPWKRTDFSRPVGEKLYVDVRSPKEFVKGSLPGALHIPLPELEARLGELPEDRHLVFFCKTGKRSEKAVALVGSRRSCSSLPGGIDAR